VFKPIERYRPERHYMRGPGPKWFETHGGRINRVGPVTDSHRHDKYLLASFFFRLVRRWQASSSGISGAQMR
jgi:hypothetical protein